MRNETTLRGQVIVHQLIQEMPIEMLTEGIKNAYTEGKAEAYTPSRKFPAETL